MAFVSVFVTLAVALLPAAVAQPLPKDALFLVPDTERLLFDEGAWAVETLEGARLDVPSLAARLGDERMQERLTAERRRTLALAVPAVALGAGALAGGVTVAGLFASDRLPLQAMYGSVGLLLAGGVGVGGGVGIVHRRKVRQSLPYMYYDLDDAKARVDAYNRALPRP